MFGKLRASKRKGRKEIQELMNTDDIVEWR
jgi:hypothetical protein